MWVFLFGPTDSDTPSGSRFSGDLAHQGIQGVSECPNAKRGFLDTLPCRFPALPDATSAVW
jgi:hypothetical protein